MAALISGRPLPRSSRCCSVTRACPLPLRATATTSAFWPPFIPPRNSPPLAGGIGSSGRGLLLLLAGASDHHAGGDAHPAAILPATAGRDAAARTEARVGAALQNPALSTASTGGRSGVYLHADPSQPRAGRTGRRGWNRLFRLVDLSGSRAKAGTVALCADSHQAGNLAARLLPSSFVQNSKSFRKIRREQNQFTNSSCTTSSICLHVREARP